MIGRMKAKAKQRLRSFVVNILNEEAGRLATLTDQLKEYGLSPASQRQSYYEGIHDPLELRKRFEALGLSVEEAQIDQQDFESWRRHFKKLDAVYARSATHMEKLLEHYLTYRWLGLIEGSMYVDIAAHRSIWADLLVKKGVNAHKLDLAYEEGRHDREIGASADNIPLDDASVDGLSLQCAFETFQGSADMGFIPEAERIMKPGARLAIIPLYVDSTHFVMSSPLCDLAGVSVDPGAIRVWREDANQEPFSRHYSPDAFVDRILSRITGMDATVTHFTNVGDLAAQYPGQRIYCHFMLKAERHG